LIGDIPSHKWLGYFQVSFPQRLRLNPVHRMNQLYFGDNLNVLREHLKDESVDLI
jgi:hypothetical protein